MRGKAFLFFSLVVFEVNWFFRRRNRLILRRRSFCWRDWVLWVVMGLVVLCLLFCLGCLWLLFLFLVCLLFTRDGLLFGRKRRRLLLSIECLCLSGLLTLRIVSLLEWRFFFAMVRVSILEEVIRNLQRLDQLRSWNEDLIFVLPVFLIAFILVLVFTKYDLPSPIFLIYRCLLLSS